MSINGVNNSQPAFTAKTKEGNDYNSTNAGKVVGGTIAGVKVFKGIRRTASFNKSIVGDNYVKTKAEQVLADGKTIWQKAESAISNNKDLKIRNNRRMASTIMGLAVKAGLLLGTGAVIDKLINNKRAKSADKAAY